MALPSISLGDNMTDWLPDGQGAFEFASEDKKTGIITYDKAVDIAPVLNENLRRQSDPQNGFFRETRDSRHIGEIPEIAYYRDVHPKFKALEAQGVSGKDLMIHKGTILRNYLNEHPEYRVVDKLVHHTANESHIQVK